MGFVVIVVVVVVVVVCMPGAQNQDLEAAESSESGLEAAESKKILSFGVSPKNKIPPPPKKKKNII